MDFLLRGLTGQDLDADFYAEALESKDRFIREYFRFDLNLRNAKVAYINKALGRPADMDIMTGEKGNILRWEKYDRLFSSTDRISLDRFKMLMTAEQTDTDFTEIRSNGLVFLLIADYDSRTLQAAFTGREGVADMPDFLDLGTF